MTLYLNQQPNIFDLPFKSSSPYMLMFQKPLFLVILDNFNQLLVVRYDQNS